MLIGFFASRWLVNSHSSFRITLLVGYRKPNTSLGEVAERLNAPVLKTGMG